MSPTITTQIEIAASPERVRQVMLDFPNFKSWTADWILTTQTPNQAASTLQKGDKINVNMKGVKFSPTIVENSPACFQWIGNLYVFWGTHQFHFNPSTTTPGGTTLVQKEDFGGPLSFLMRSGWSMGESTKGNFEKLNGEIKAAAESG